MTVVDRHLIKRLSLAPKILVDVGLFSANRKLSPDREREVAQESPIMFTSGGMGVIRPVGSKV